MYCCCQEEYLQMLRTEQEVRLLWYNGTDEANMQKKDTSL